MALGGTAHPPRSLPENYHDLCPDFILSDAGEAMRDFRILEMVQAVFYAMVVNKTLEVGVLGRDLAEHLRSALEGHRWFIFKAWLQLNRHALLWAYRHRQVIPGAGPRPASDQEDSSESSDAPPPSSDDE